MPSLSYLVKRLAGMNYKNFFERIKTVNQKCNKNKFVIFCDMVWCGLRYGAGYVDYDVIGFYKLNSAQRKTMLTRGINNKFVKKLNEKDYWHIFDNKNEFNETFSKFISRKWLYPISEKKDEALQFIKQHEIIFAKPNNGQCGKGIEKIKTAEWDEQKLYEHLVESKLELIEEPIAQHAEMNKLNNTSVNTTRIVTVMNAKGDVTILTAFSRIGNGKHVDNFNSGGMTAKVERKTGKIIEKAVNKAGELFEKHPITGTRIKDFQIPYFAEAREMVIEAAKLSPHVRYIGWDVAITTEGPTLVEGNQFPGHDIYQVAEKMKEGQLGVLPDFEKAIE